MAMMEITKFKNKLKKLPTKKSLLNELGKAAGEAFAEDLKVNIAYARASAGGDYSIGAGNEIGRVLKPKAKGGVATVTWRGDDVMFWEFGTGLMGSGLYPDQAYMSSYGYEPVPYGHSHDEWWILPEIYWRGDNPLGSRGWAPYAPMYNTRMDFETRDKMDQAIGKILTKTVEKNL